MRSIDRQLKPDLKLKYGVTLVASIVGSGDVSTAIDCAGECLSCLAYVSIPRINFHQTCSEILRPSSIFDIMC